MTTNNFLFFLKLVLVRWTGKYIKLFLVSFGYVLLSVFALLVYNLKLTVTERMPPWVQTSDEVYSVSNQFEDGAIGGLNKNVFSAISESANVTQASYLMNKNLTLQTEDGVQKTLNAVMFSNNLISHLNIPFDYVDNNDLASGVWISRTLLKNEFDNDMGVIGKKLYHKRIKDGIIIKGVLPETLETIGPWRIDIWLPASYYQDLTPFLDQASIDSFLTAAPLYYTFLSAEPSFKRDFFESYLQSTDFSVSQMRMTLGASEIKVFKGVVLDSESFRLLEQQLLLFVLFVFCLGLVLLLNGSTMHYAQSVVYSEDDKMLEVLGSKFSNLIIATGFFIFIKVCLIAIIACLVYYLVSSLIQQTEAYARFVGILSLDLSITSILAMFLVITAMNFGAGVCPYILGKRKLAFMRSNSNSQSSVIKVSLYVVLTVQLFVATAAICLVLLLSAAQLDKLNDVAIEKNIYSTHISQRSGNISFPNLQAETQAIFQSVFAYSLTPFDQPTAISLEHENLLEPRTIYISYVSSGYFELMTGTPVSDWGTSIVINKNLQELLYGNDKDSKGLSLDLGTFYEGQHTIGAVVNNIPHFGISSYTPPMIYLPIENFSRSPTNSLYFYSKNADAHKMLSPVLTDYLVNFQIEQTQSIQSILWKQDATQWLINVLTIAFVCLILLLSALSLSYQFIAQIETNTFEYGLYLALGSSKTSLFIKIAKQVLLCFIVSIIGFSVMLFMYADDVFELIQLDTQLSTPLIATSILSSLALCGIASFVPINRFFKQSIYPMVK